MFSEGKRLYFNDAYCPQSHSDPNRGSVKPFGYKFKKTNKHQSSNVYIISHNLLDNQRLDVKLIIFKLCFSSKKKTFVYHALENKRKQTLVANIKSGLDAMLYKVF